MASSSTGAPLAGISLCAGYGGLDLGLHIAEPGYRTALARRTRGTSGRRSSASLANAAPRSHSSRTSRATSRWDLPTSASAFDGWVMALKRACFRRTKSALARSGAAYSYWHTPTASMSGNHVALHARPDGYRFQARADLPSTQCGLWQEALAWTLIYLVMKGAGASFSKAEASFRSSPPVQVNLSVGTPALYRALTFNPAFTDWVMGWPIGWTDCAAPVTGFARWLQRMRGELSRLPCANEEALRAS